MANIEHEIENKHFTNNLIRAGRTAKKLKKKKGGDTKIKLGSYKALVNKDKNHKEVLEIIQNVFKNKQEMTPDEFIKGIYNYKDAPKNIKGVISDESKSNTKQRLIPDAERNKTYNATIFSSILDELEKKFPNADEEFRKFSKYFPEGHFKNSAAFVRYTKMTDDWIHFDAFQTDFFNKIRRDFKSSKGKEEKMADFLLSKEEDFYRLTVSYIVKSNPSVKQFTANTPSLVKKPEKVSGTGKLRQLYEKLPKKLGFKKITLSQLKKIFKTRKGEKFEKKVSKINKVFDIPDDLDLDIGFTVTLAIKKIKEDLEQVNKKTIEKDDIDKVIQNSTNEKAAKIAFRKNLDDIVKAVKEDKLGEFFNKNKIEELKKIVEDNQNTETGKEIWWFNRQMIFEDVVERAFGKLIFELKGEEILKNIFEDYSNMNDLFTNAYAREIYNAGKSWKEFDYEKGLNALTKKDEIGKWIFSAGENWPKFNYEKGFEALIKKDKKGKIIYHIGIDWPKFNYEKGLDTLIEKDKDGWWILSAGEEWSKFNYKKGFEALKKKSKDYYQEALNTWPKTLSDVKKDKPKTGKTNFKKTKKLKL